MKCKFFRHIKKVLENNQVNILFIIPKLVHMLIASMLFSLSMSPVKKNKPVIFSSVRSTSSENADYSLGDRRGQKGTKVPKIFREI